MFSMVSAFLLRRPPGRDPDTIAVVTAIDPGRGFQADASTLSVPNYLAWREANHVFTETAASDPYRTVSLTLQRQSEAQSCSAVSSNYFKVLGVAAQLGRTFAGGEDQAGRDHVVILSHEIWERRFGADASIVGQSVRLNREPYTVVGVMPASFQMLGFTPRVWIPLVTNAADLTTAARKDRSLYMFARMKPGVKVEQARADMVTLGRRTEEAFPDSEKGWGVMVRTLPDFLIYGFGIRSGLAVMMTTVGFVLMIACANVAGLLLARAAGRRKELAIRGALGAGRLRIVRQLLTEGLVISLLGGGLGLLLSSWGIKLVASGMTFNEAISAVPLKLDWSVALFAAGISLVCAVLCGLIPALNASRTDITTNLKDESRTASAGRSHSRLRTVMVTGEIALALVLLVGVGLLFRELFIIEHQNLGFRPDHLLTASLTLDSARYNDAYQQVNFVRDLIPRVQNIPGVVAAAVVSNLPATGAGDVSLHFKDQPDTSSDQAPTALHYVVTPDYFRAAGVGLWQGRTFTEADSVSAPPVVLVNREFVHRLLHDQEPFARQVRLDVGGAAPEWRQIVGVVENVKTYSEATREEPEVYEPFLQHPVSTFSVLLRTNSDPNTLAPVLRSTLAQVDSDLPLSNVMSMAAVLERQKAGNPLFVHVLATFAMLALILSAIGIYGLVAYSVGQRTHEIGIRMALGAKSQDVLRMVLSQGIKMAGIGAAVGLVLALPLPKIFGAIFFDLHVNEPRLYLVVPAIIFLVAIAATYIPARRAARVDPMSALRQE
jgi:predicted permease